MRNPNSSGGPAPRDAATVRAAKADVVDRHISKLRETAFRAAPDRMWNLRGSPVQ